MSWISYVFPSTLKYNIVLFLGLFIYFLCFVSSNNVRQHLQRRGRRQINDQRWHRQRQRQRPKMQSLRKKLSDFEAGKEEEVKRLVLEAKENMRDEVGVRARKRQQNMVLLLCYCVVLLPLQKTRS